MSCAANVPSGSEAYGKLYPEKSSDGMCYMPCAQFVLTAKSCPTIAGQ